MFIEAKISPQLLKYVYFLFISLIDLDYFLVFSDNFCNKLHLKSFFPEYSQYIEIITRKLYIFLLGR